MDGRLFSTVEPTVLIFKEGYVSEVAKELIRLWRDYQKSGTPYGNTVEGLLAWLQDKELDNV